MKVLVVFSGGQDSTTCLYWAMQRFPEVIALTFDYGQRHSIEIESARKIAKMAHVPLEVLKIPDILKGTSPLVDKTREVESYESADVLPGGLEKTFVPGRNILFLTLAANRAYTERCGAIVTGVSQEDFGGYPDCRKVFIEKMTTALCSGLDYPLSIATPLISLTKKETAIMADGIYGCMDALAWSHTCYKGESPPCGTCHACLLRERGFEQACLPDPLIERLTHV